MNKVNTLSLKIYKNEWFALENKDMEANTFLNIVNTLNKAFVDEYGVEGAKEHINRVDKDGRTVLFINQRKVPNIVKSLVQSTNMDIQISLTGVNTQNEEVTKMMTKPFISNDCTEIIPYYNNNKTIKR